MTSTRFELTKQNPKASRHLGYFGYFLGVIALTFTAQTVCFMFISNSFWSCWIVTGAVFQALLLVGIFPFCKKPTRLLALLFLIELELLTADALKVRVLGTSLMPGDIYLLPEFIRLIATVTFSKKLAFYGMLLLLPLTWLGTATALFKWKRKPPAHELIWLTPLLGLAFWLVLFPNSYRREIAGFIGDEPIQARTRAETYGRVLNLTLELAGLIEEYEYRPSAQEVATAQLWFRSFSHDPITPAAAHARNIYIILVESFWDPGRLHSAVTDNGKILPFLAPEFMAAWQANGSQLMFSPVYGSGTANTEFEILCGIPASLVSNGIVLLEGLSNRLPCLPRILRDNGYRSFAFHSNLASYYNRDTQFPAMGFERFFSIVDFKSDELIGSFLADQSFIHQSVELARNHAGGRPYLAYLMTMAGHWPYPWSDREYQHTFAVPPTLGQGEYFDEISRQININLYTSQLIAKTIAQLAKEDPKALVIVTGDHLPPTALALASFDGKGSNFLTAPVWYQTPLLYIDGKPHADSIPLAAFELGNKIMDSVGIPINERRHFQYFGRLNQDLIRPVAPEKVFRLHPDGNFDLCKASSEEPRCAEPVAWLKKARALAVDLARGKQYSLSHPL